MQAKLTVTILAGNTTATIDVSVMDNLALESSETVIVTLSGITASDPQVTLGTPLEVTVNAQPATKVYGQLDPTLTFVSNPVVGIELPNHDLISFTGALSRTPLGDAVGIYPIGQNTVANSNYTITYVGANLTISLATSFFRSTNSVFLH